jgi:N-acetylglucosamine-6-phosphate deacetylase
MLPDDDPAVMHASHAVLASRVFDGHRWHSAAAVLIDADGRIRAIAPWGEVPGDWPQRRLPDGAVLAPGFIDLQVNGGGGVLLNDDPSPEAMRAIARVHRRYGVTACLPTLLTDNRQQTQAAIVAARMAAGRDGVLGVHLEGPFISPARPGIHRPDRIAGPHLNDLDWLGDLAGAGRSMVTLAPEQAPDGFVKRLAAAGVRVSAGHSEAPAGVMMRAVDDGLTGVTHLFNAMPPLAGRAPGIVGAALAEPRLIAGIIVDGIHVDPLSVRAAFAAKGAGGMMLVSDAMPSVGADVAAFDLMGRTIELRDGRLTGADGTLAGAHLDLASAVRNAVTLANLPLEDALRAASQTPAAFLGLEWERGALINGARADMVALTDGLQVILTWVGGEEEPAA